MAKKKHKTKTVSFLLLIIFVNNFHDYFDLFTQEFNPLSNSIKEFNVYQCGFVPSAIHSFSQCRAHGPNASRSVSRNAQLAGSGETLSLP